MVKLTFSYHKKLVALFLVLSLVPLFIIGSYLYFDKTNAENNHLQEKLVSISTVGADNVANWIAERKKNVLDIANNQLIVAETKKLRHPTGDSELFTARFRLAEQLSVSLQSYDWLREVTISNPETGDVIFHTDITFEKINLKDEIHFQEAVKRTTGVSEVYRSIGFIKNEYGSYEKGVPTFLISVPIAGEVGLEGVLTARVDIFKIDPVVMSYLTEFTKTDSYLINSEGYFLSKSMFPEQIRDLNLIKKRPELELQVIEPQTGEHTKIFTMAKENGDAWNMDGYNNYIGTCVLGAITKVDGTNWYYIAEVDKNLAYQGIIQLQTTLVSSIVLLILTITVVALLFSKTLVNPIKKLTEVTRLISTKNLDIEIDPKLKESKNEIGELASEFDDMRQRILIQTCEIQKANDKLAGKEKELVQTNEELKRRVNDDLLVEQMMRTHYTKEKQLTADLRELTKKLNKSNAELRRKDQLKDEFISIASHELKTPIQPILGYAELAKRGAVAQEEAWDSVIRNAERLQTLANSILDVSRIQAGSLKYSLEVITLNDLILDAVNATTANLNGKVELKTELDMDVVVNADRDRIVQVLTNMIGNAIKFTREGYIKVESRVIPDANKVKIMISDTGGGIPVDILPDLFTKFMTNNVRNENRHGTGLGLFICKAIVTAHAGEISACNNMEGGATFEILLPIVKVIT
jgi:signal transduction histidine kinase